MVIDSLFPTPIGWFKNDAGILKKENKYILNLDRKPNLGNSISANKNVLEDKQLKNLKDWIINKVDLYFEKTHKPALDTKLYITQSWCNYTKKGEHHHKHSHRNSFISGVYYVQANIEQDRIKFFNDVYKQLSVVAREYNVWNSETWYFNVESDLLVLFPSSLNHMVETVDSDKERISLSFNTFLKGVIGNEEASTGLHL